MKELLKSHMVATQSAIEIMVGKKVDVALAVKKVECTALAVFVREALRNKKFQTALSTFIKECD